MLSVSQILGRENLIGLAWDRCPFILVIGEDNGSRGGVKSHEICGCDRNK